MTDIVEKLRGPNPVSWVPEAIDEIERLRAALEPFALEALTYEPDEGDGDDSLWGSSRSTSSLRIRHLREARLALGENK